MAERIKNVDENRIIYTLENFVKDIPMYINIKYLCCVIYYTYNWQN